MDVFDTCKNEEDPIKNEGARVLTIFLPFNASLWELFSYSQGQLTPQSVDEWGRHSNSSEIVWLPSLPARIKIQSK